MIDPAVLGTVGGVILAAALGIRWCGPELRRWFAMFWARSDAKRARLAEGKAGRAVRGPRPKARA